MHHPIIQSLLDTDLYKLTMMQCIFHQFPKTHVTYRLKSRKPTHLPYFASLKEQLTHFCTLRFTQEELYYLKSLPYFKEDFIDYLARFRLNESCLKLQRSPLDMTIQGTWLETILFEVPVLAIINEIHSHHANISLDQARLLLQQKTTFLSHQPTDFYFADFGTRRRYSYVWQQEVLSTLAAFPHFMGTSNLYFAKQLHLEPIGTMAHEYLQACQVLAPQLKGSQHFALNVWLKEYPQLLGIALTDTLTMDIFLSEFDLSLAQQYSGLRQDSGDPFIWGEKAIAHYRSLGINPADKIFVFSDSLTFDKANKIYHHFKGRCQPQFGIGTYLMNDVGLMPLDIVIKMTETNHQPVVKISDSSGKTTCEDKNYLQQVKKIFAIKD